MPLKLTRNEGRISSRRRTVAWKTKSSRRAYVRIEAYRVQRGVRDREKEGERERNAFYRGEREAERGMKSRERGRTREERVHGEMSRLSNGRRYRLVAGRPQFAHRGVFGGRSASLSFSFFLSLSLSISLFAAQWRFLPDRSRSRVVASSSPSSSSSSPRCIVADMRYGGVVHQTKSLARIASASRRSRVKRDNLDKLKIFILYEISRSIEYSIERIHIYVKHTLLVQQYIFCMFDWIHCAISTFHNLKISVKLSKLPYTLPYRPRNISS